MLRYVPSRASLVAQLVNNPPAMQETWVKFLGQEDPLKKEMAIHSSILAWKIPWTEEPGRVQSMGSKESDMTSRLNHLNQPAFEGFREGGSGSKLTHSSVSVQGSVAAQIRG